MIAWAPEDRPTDAQIEAVPDKFERTAWAGLKPDRYAWTADKHRAADAESTTVAVRRGSIYDDLASGVRDDRPGLDSSQRVLRKGDVLVVRKLDRLGRNLARLVNTVQNVSARGVGRRADDEGADRHHDRGRPPRVQHLRSAG